MVLVARAVELGRIEELVASGLAGRGGLLVVVGASGSGKSALLGEAVTLARRRGMRVSGGSAAESTGRTVWVRLLQEVRGPSELLEAFATNDDPTVLDAAARLLSGADHHLIVMDDLDRGGPEALDLLTKLAGHLPIGSSTVIVSSHRALGVGAELRLGGLSEGQLAEVISDVPAELRRAVWRASGGMPGVARTLLAGLTDRPTGDDSLVHLALHARSTAGFLEVDSGVVLLLEAALEHAAGDADRARLSARLARELLGDAMAGERRRSLVEEALMLARRSGDRQALADALDARLHALWDPSAAQDRLDAAAEIADLARVAGDPVLERSGLFWRFVALMELARVAEAESALAAFGRLARLAGDEEALVMVSARLAMLATLRGRFAEAAQLVDEVAIAGRRVGMADTAALVGTLRGALLQWREDVDDSAVGLEAMTAAAREQPGHLFEASVARVLAFVGRHEEAAAELKRTLPQLVPGSGPRWVGAVADLSAVAAVTGDADAARRLYDALLPYRGRLVIWGGANTVTGPAAYYLGLLAVVLHRQDDAVDLLSEAADTAEQIGALPWLAHTLSALADVLVNRGRPDDSARAAAGRDRARVLAHQLGLVGLLRRLAPLSDEWTLRREPEGDWLLQAGDERARLRDSRGLHHLRILLSAPPRVEVSALDLAAGGAGLASSNPAPVLDQSAVQSYRRRLAELELELDGADRAGDAGSALRIETEREALLRELRHASGLGGRVRATSDEAERARINVTRTLRTALDRVSEVAPRAGAHLTASIRTGSACRYDPAEGGPTRWHV